VFYVSVTTVVVITFQPLLIVIYLLLIAGVRTLVSFSKFWFMFKL